MRGAIGEDRALADRCAARVRELYGDDLPRDAGVLHVVAVWRAPDGRDRVLHIVPETPRSETDRFVLDVARARADAIVATGRILRDEPGVTHACRTDVEGLTAWRRLALGRDEAPRSAILTSGRELDLDHPLLNAAEAPLIYTGGSAARHLGNAARSRGIEVVALQRPGIREVVADLRARGARTISIEAGPTTAAGLYEPPLLVDELMLSVFDEPALARSLQGPEMPWGDRLTALLPGASAPHRVSEPSGGWCFQRRWRGV